MGSKSSSKSAQSSTSNPVTLQDVEGLQIIGNSGPVEITDAGAIEGSLGLAGSVMEKAAELTIGLVSAQADASRAALDSVMKNADQGYQFAMSAGRSDVAMIQEGGRGLLILAGIAAAAFVLSKWAK